MTTSAPLVEQTFQRFPATFARLVGRNGTVREYRALLAPTAESCILPRVDAYRLGYPEAAASSTRIPQPNSLMFANLNGYGRATAIKMARVDMGGISFHDVEFLAFDILQATGFDVVLGQSLLRQTRLDLHLETGTLRLEGGVGAR